LNRWEGSGGAFVGSQVFEDGTTGDGVHVLIEQNGAAKWPTDPDYLTYRSVSPADHNGYASDVDLTVSAGGILRFVVGRRHEHRRHHQLDAVHHLFVRQGPRPDIAHAWQPTVGQRNRHLAPARIMSTR